MSEPKLKKITLHESDISVEYAELVCKAGVVAWDIETSGLDWRSDRIGTCQLYVSDGMAAVVILGDSVPSRLQAILSDARVKKVFHHAVFDLSFICYRWKLSVQNIACTKIAAKLLNPDNRDNYTLESLLGRYFGIKKNRDQRLSNWCSHKLSKEQIDYAVNDVRYLLQLLEIFEHELESKGLLELARQSFAHIPTRVLLDILGYKDIYSY